MAAALVGDGRYADAVRVAEDAYKRSPDDLNIVVLWAQAAYALLEQSPGQKELERLSRTVEEIQRAAPGEPNTLPIYAAVLARGGNADAAAQVVRSALSADPPPPPAVLARLATVSREASLGLDDEIAKRLGQAVAAPGAADAGPGAAIVAAMDRFDAGRPKEGLDLLNAARAKAGAAGDTLAWQLAVAQYLDAIGDPSAHQTWVDLADKNPKDLGVQSAALRTRSRFQDRELWRRTIDRVKQLTVENSQLWRLEDARWILTAPELSELNQSNVLTTLHELARNAPQSPEPRRLLAVAYERSASAAGATVQKQQEALNSAVKAMQEACDLRPGDVGMVADLCRLLRAAGRGDEGVKYLDRLAARPRLEPAARARLAELYADQGLTRRALEIAAPLVPSPIGNNGDAQRPAAVSDPVAAAVIPRMARWHRSLGEDDQAAALYQALLAAPDGGESEDAGRGLTAQTVLDAANFFAGRGNRDEAEKFLARLDAMSLQPGAKELVRAKFCERQVPQEAAKWYQAAATTAHAPAGVWRELAGYHLRQRHFAEAADAADSGLKHYAKDADLLAIKQRARELEPLAEDPAAQPLFSFLSFDPRNAPAVEMLSILTASRDGKQKPEETAAKLRAAADKSPSFLPLQVAAARAHLRAGDAARAEQLARRAAANFPDDVDAIRLLASVYAAQGKWPELRDAATNWRRLTPRDTLEPDLLLARVALNDNDATGAQQRLEPYAKAHLAKAQAGVEDANAEVIDLYARALIAQGKAADAADMLEPLARHSPTWRRLWLDLAGAFRTRELEAAAAWVTRVEPSVPRDSAREQVQLAGAWYVVGREFGDRESLQNARKLAEPWAGDASVAAEATTLLASCDEGLGNLADAEREYRQALKLRPGHSDVLNNLAYVLLLRWEGTGLAEARDLANKAIAANPSVASYYDTLGRIEAKLGNSDAAVSAFQKALARDGSSLEAMIGLADVLSHSNRRDEARQQLALIDNALRASPRLPAPLAKQLESVRTSLRSEVESGRVE
jgi:tetratricopeptide (TPR) repeat protein